MSYKVKKLIKQLSELFQSNEDFEIKVDGCCKIFESFVSTCKGDEIALALQSFVVLSQMLGLNVNKENDANNFIILEGFKNDFNVELLTPPESYRIFKKLLFILSKTSINLNLTELQHYNKWLQELIKSLASSQPFQNVFLEIFSICADIDLKLVEGNFDAILCNVLTQKQQVDDFSFFYAVFLENILKTFVKFQKTVKFITKFLSIIKVTPTHLVKETVLPNNVISEFSRTVAVSTNQQSLLLFDILIQNLEVCFCFISQNDSEHVPLLFYITSDLLISFLKEVKLFSTSVASTTLQLFISKLNNLKEVLQKFGSYLFNSKTFMLKNQKVTETFLSLCFYCGEIDALINCYKDSILEPSHVPDSTADCDWQCCISSEQWSKLVKFVLKSKLETCSKVNFQLALQNLRDCKLHGTTPSEDSTLKLIIYQLKSDLDRFNIFQELPPDDLTILLDALKTKQSQTVIKSIFKQILASEDKSKWRLWISNSIVQENSFFIVHLFSQIIKETGAILENLVSDKNQSKISWFSGEFFSSESFVREDVLESLPGKINVLLRNSKRIRKSVETHARPMDLFELFKLLPFPFMKDDFRRVGLSFAVGVGTLLPDEASLGSVLDSICKFLATDTDPSTCFDIGFCIKWLSGLHFEDENVNDVKTKVIESLVRNSPNMRFGLSQMGELIDSAEGMKHLSQIQMLETGVVLYNELGKCWQRAKKRKSDNDLIGSYRIKLAKIISDSAKEVKEDNINSENSKMLFRVLSIELNKAIKTNDEKELESLGKEKLPLYFEFAVKTLKKEFDEGSAAFLAVVLQSMPQLRKFLAEDSLLRIWKSLKTHSKVNWRVFCVHSTDEEFVEISEDLLKMSKKFLTSESDKNSSNSFEIWFSFFSFATESKRNLCQLRLQDFFNYIHNCDLLLGHLPIRKKIFLIKFVCFCVNNKEVIVTSDVLDTIIHVLLECVDDSLSFDDFQNLFTAQVEVASAILLRQFSWSRSKVHLSFVIFKRLVGCLMRKCDAAPDARAEDVMKLSTCGFFLEKWVSLMIKREKDFARISAYFISTLISFIASVTVVPAVKIHLTNCINRFLSISDSHTVAYLMRLLKPGYQQVFNSAYNQFKKYHKYSGKI